MGFKKQVNYYFLIAILALVGLSVWQLFIRQPLNKAIKLGLDLRSGTHLLLALNPPLLWTGTKGDLDAATQALTQMQQKKVSSQILLPLQTVLAKIDNEGTVPQKDAKKAGAALQKLGFVAQAQPWQTLLQKLNPQKVTLKDLARVKLVLEKRINEFGTKETIIQNFGSSHIIVDIPEETNPRKAEKIVSKTAYLDFKELTAAGKQYFNQTHNPPNFYNPALWKTIMNGSALKDVQTAPYGQPGGGSTQYQVNFQLTSKGAKIFGKATTQDVGYPIAIYLDGKLISSPIVDTPITGGNGDIQSFPLNKAVELTRFLQAGALPIPIKVVESAMVGPTLGHEALLESLAAGLLGLVTVIIFMLLFYRLPGFFACLALMVYALWLLGIMSKFFILTLPGIAGIVLSIGMAVDANILIFERVKEELWNGKTIPGAVDIGFQKAWSSILDSHVTTIIGAAALIWKGSASVQGFGVALLVGTALSLLTAWGVTRILMDWSVLNNLTTSRRAYGA